MCGLVGKERAHPPHGDLLELLKLLLQVRLACHGLEPFVELGNAARSLRLSLHERTASRETEQKQDAHALTCAVPNFTLMGSD